MRPLDLPGTVAGASAARAMPAAAFRARLAWLVRQRPLVALRDVADAQGRLLLARGRRADAAFAERLAGLGADAHPENALAVEDAPQGAALAADAAAALDGHALVAGLVGSAGGAARLAGFVARVALPAPLALHLEMARLLAPELYRHGLRSALSCVALGLRSGAGEAAGVPLAAVGLFHDLGLLHADDAVLAGSPSLDPAQREQQAAHAEMSAALLRGHPPHAGAVADAVAAHHERIDGSGWPLHLAGDAMPPWARIAALAELLTTFETDGGILDALRLSNLLRLHAGAFEPGLVEIVLGACDDLERG